jgi:hypothetical protein
MKRYLLGLIGLALLGGSPLWAAECGCDGGCGKAACDPCCRCCPHCGCCLVPVCHSFCTTKKTTEHEYSCTCNTICIPGVTPLCRKCDCCDGSGHCAGGCNTCGSGCGACNDPCEDCCGCCRVRNVHKLVVHPVTKEECVKKCTVEWTCPKCGCCGATPTSVVPGSVAPTPAPARLPAPPRTTTLAPMPGQVGSL